MIDVCMIGRRLKKIVTTPSTERSTVFVIFLLVLATAFVYYSQSFYGSSTLVKKNPSFLPKSVLTTANDSASTEAVSPKPAKQVSSKNCSEKIFQYPFNCSKGNERQTCSENFSLPFATCEDDGGVCPDYFRWIHEDLKTWKDTGITKDLVKSTQRNANFRLVIVNGKAYVETYSKGFQSRDTLTLWGILQLLRRYPGRLPDLDLMFNCDDRPVILASHYQGSDAATPPPLFHYCAEKSSFEIVFPDWSFWGWPEINIKPWESLKEELKEGNKKMKWMEREPYAYWKGNPYVAHTRQDLLKCNVSARRDWKARIFAQDWNKESKRGYKESNLASQCRHRYKIYIEGNAWSVSQKYILACDSLTLLVNPKYYDFFTRSLVPGEHYWPIRADDKCRSIKFAVDFGNTHKTNVQDIGKAASSFIQDELKMDYVYDYMFHLLTEYSKLLRYKPTIPDKAVELCSEIMACPEKYELQKKFMMDTMVKSPSNKSPCSMPSPFDAQSLKSFVDKKKNMIKQVETWEKISQKVILV